MNKSGFAPVFRNGMSNWAGQFHKNRTYYNKDNHQPNSEIHRPKLNSQLSGTESSLMTCKLDKISKKMKGKSVDT